MLSEYDQRENKRIRTLIQEVVIQDDPDTRACFLQHFKTEVEDFISAMSYAYYSWSILDAGTRYDEKKAHVASLVYSAINNQIVSMKLFIAGYIVAAGNLQRQLIETIALACLGSGKHLNILDCYWQVTTQHRTLLKMHNAYKQRKSLGLNQDAFQRLKQSRDFYHQFSHPTLLTIGAQLVFSRDDSLYLGGSFDATKLEQYQKEINTRLGVAKAFGNFVEGIKSNLDKW